MGEMLFEPFETYITRGLLYHHFTKPKFNFFAQENNVAIRRQFWKKWKDSPNMHGLWISYTRRFKKPEDMRDHFLSVMVTRSPKEYAGLYDLECYHKWLGRLHSMHVNFDDDLNRLRRKAGSLKKAIRPPEGEHPALYTMLMSGQVSMETFGWLAFFQPKILDVMDESFDKTMDLAWKEKRMVALKYSTFLTRLNIDQNRLKSILRGYLV